MAKEFRRITFNKLEMRGALETSAASSGAKLPAGDVVSVKASRVDNAFFYELSLFDYTKQKEGSVNLPEEQALEALLSHSIEAGIPLPRAARKEVREIDGALCLDMFIE
jgi:hypothetical protein